MAALPEPQATTAQAVLRWWAAQPDPHRAHLGASLIGAACDRRLWLTFRWAGKEQFDGRMRRLFDHGKREESRVVEELRGIGCEVHADDGQAQFRVSACDGHFGGSFDGVVRGLPEAPKTWHVLEVKTHSSKSFKDLQAKGVQAAKPQHYAQMQAYMLLGDLDRALYYAVNKDTDELHIERVPLDEKFARSLVERAQRIISADTPPQRLSTDPAWFECKWCPFHAACHGQQVPETNCRTCVHSSPVADGAWQCADKHRTITLAQQRQVCEQHRFIPPMLERFGEAVDMDGDAVVYQTPAGVRFSNGAPGWSSADMHAMPAEAIGHETVECIKAAFPTAKVTA